MTNILFVISAGLIVAFATPNAKGQEGGYGSVADIDQFVDDVAGSNYTSGQQIRVVANGTGHVYATEATGFDFAVIVNIYDVGNNLVASGGGSIFINPGETKELTGICTYVVPGNPSSEYFVQVEIRSTDSGGTFLDDNFAWFYFVEG